VAILFAGCGSGNEEPATDEEARTLAADAAQAVSVLEKQTDALADRIDELEAAGGKTGDRIDEISDRLWASLAKLRSSLRDIESSSSDAAANASSALAEAQQAARDLAVLDSRLDYHLNHGGD
jgi:hypothetical protein